MSRWATRSSLVAADAAREHIAALAAAGMGSLAVARAAGLSRSAVWCVRERISVLIEQDSLDRILAVELAIAPRGCECGRCRKCRHRAAVQRSRSRGAFYEPRELDAELVRLFPVFAEELASVMRFPIRNGRRRRAAL